MSEKLTEAIKFATEKHEGQIRKASGAPYIMHPLEVGVILCGLTAEEDVVIAGILHDTIEMCHVTLEEITEKFGSRVAEIVSGESETIDTIQVVEDAWRLRKANSIEILKTTNDISIHMLWLADKLANMRGIHRLWTEEGDKVFERFSNCDKREHEWYYRMVLKYTHELCDTAAYEEYENLVNKVFY